jgi:hypothetical protein
MESTQEQSQKLDFLATNKVNHDILIESKNKEESKIMVID